MAVTIKIKRGMGLGTRKAAPPMKLMREASNVRAKQRPMTSMEITRQQMGVTEQSDTWLRKTVMRTLVGPANISQRSSLLIVSFD